MQHILKQKETSLIKQFLTTQMETLKKKDWGKTVREDILHLGLDISFADIEIMPKQTYKKLIRQKIQQKSFEYLINKRNNRNGKGMAISYHSLEMQNYLLSEDMEITNNDRKHIFQFRTQMSFDIKSHFRNMHANTICDGCRLEESTTYHA